MARDSAKLWARWDAILDRSRLAKALYASDASLFRVEPLAVARPRSTAELNALVSDVVAANIAITARGAGTSCAGNAVGPGIVIDLRLLNQIIDLDPDQRTAIVEPGVVLADLNKAAARYGLRFGPDPSTASRCTIGGMIGNNACGPRALGYGRTADNIQQLQLIRADGLVGTQAHEWGKLAQIVAKAAPLIRTEFGRFSRQVSGYSLEHLLPENGFNVAKFLAGSEGTLGVISSATLRLVSQPTQTVLVALGYPSMADAADAVPLLLPFRPTACEGLDDRIVDVVRQRLGEQAVPELPQGLGLLIIEIAGDDSAEVQQRAQAMAEASQAIDHRIATADQAKKLWKIRADGAGLAAVALERLGLAGWEDAAVPPQNLGAYLREFETLLAHHQLQALPYGHFGEGCVHARIDFDLNSETGKTHYRRFMTEAAELVSRYQGSMSGEHGDGRARSELLSTLYTPAALEIFSEIKTAYDPANIFNPGVLVDPVPIDANLKPGLGLAGPHRCTGVGACVSQQAGTNMCPSFRATGKEQDSTRGRARVLQEAESAGLINGLHSPEVIEVLDTCLACKACRSECPTNVDLASLKSQALYIRYRNKIRPRSHYSLGWLPTWLRLLRKIPASSAMINAVIKWLGTPQLRHLRRLFTAAIGIDHTRQIPDFKPPIKLATQPGNVLIWADSFSPTFSPQNLTATMAVLTDAGFNVGTVKEGVCCGLTWITTGQRERAQQHLRHALDVLTPLIQQGAVIVGLEPSCIAVWRSDAEELLSDDPRVALVRDSIKTLAEVLQTTSWQPPQLHDHTLVVQPHCHHRAVMRFTADQKLLEATGATVIIVAGCCGMAGNFGMETDHAELSKRVAELELLPTLKQHPDALVIADGFSCRTQIKDLAEHNALSLAELFYLHRKPKKSDCKQI